MYADIKLMIGYRPVIIWKYMWQFVTPAIVTVSSILLLYSYLMYFYLPMSIPYHH